MDRHDIWQWASIVVLWSCHNMNAVLAGLLTIMNIAWVGIRIWTFLTIKRDPDVKE